MTILTVDQYRTLSSDSTTSDDAIQQALYRYTAIIEAYCNRTFGPTAYNEVYYNVQSDPLILNHAQVQELVSVTAGVTEEDVSELEAHLGNGFIFHEGAWNEADVEVEYIAGEEAPYDVKHVLEVLVTGYLAGTTGGVSALLPIAKETVYGVSSTNYDLSSRFSETGGNAELGPFTTLLDRYVEPVLA